MRKTSIYLDDEVDAALARRAVIEGTTKAELIRAALLEAVRLGPRIKPKAVAVFAGPADLASRTDEYLSETGFGQS